MQIRKENGVDRLRWKFKAFGFTPAEFGQPPTRTAAQLCLYDVSGRRVAAFARPGGTCGTQSCWVAKRSGFDFRAAGGCAKTTFTTALKSSPTAFDAHR